MAGVSIQNQPDLWDRGMKEYGWKLFQHYAKDRGQPMALIRDVEMNLTNVQMFPLTSPLGVPLAPCSSEPRETLYWHDGEVRTLDDWYPRAWAAGWQSWHRRQTAATCQAMAMEQSAKRERRARLRRSAAIHRHFRRSKRHLPFERAATRLYIREYLR